MRCLLLTPSKSPLFSIWGTSFLGTRNSGIGHCTWPFWMPTSKVKSRPNLDSDEKKMCAWYLSPGDTQQQHKTECAHYRGKTGSLIWEQKKINNLKSVLNNNHANGFNQWWPEHARTMHKCVKFEQMSIFVEGNTSITNLQWNPMSNQDHEWTAVQAHIRFLLLKLFTTGSRLQHFGVMWWAKIW